MRVFKAVFILFWYFQYKYFKVVSHICNNNPMFIVGVIRYGL